MDGILSRYDNMPLRHAWTYCAANGTPLGVVGRYDGPDRKAVVPFFKRNGIGWKPGAAAEPRPLFGLATLARLPADGAVLVVEGEKCAAALHGLGLAAVTSPGGSKAASKADWTPLSGVAMVYLLPDQDEPGEGYARAVCAALQSLAKPPRLLLVRLPDLPEGGDVVDWLQARCAGWDGFAPIPATERGRLREDLQIILRKLQEPPPAAWGGESAETWPAPIPLDAAALPPWPGEVLPEPLCSFARGLSASTETPPELVTLEVLAVLGTIAGGRYRVRIAPDYFEPVNLWTVCALPPGSRKTAVEDAVKAPLSAWDRNQRDRLAEPIARAESERATLQARILKLRQKAAGVEDRAAVDALQAEIKQLEQALPEVPTVPQSWTGDVTPENLATIMADNGERMGVLSDEGGIFSIIAGRYSQGMANLDVFLQGHAGSPVRVNRGSRPPVFLERPALSMGLAVQPELLRGLTACREFRGRGLLARFLYAVPPSNLGRRTLEGKPLSEDLQLRYAGILTALLNSPGASDDDGKPAAHILKLTAEAFACWKAYQREIEPTMGEGGRFEHLTDWASKLPGAVARIAALLHIARHALTGPERRDIGPEDMQAAIRLGCALEGHALAAFDLMGADPALDGARAVLRWIERERLQTFTFRDCHYHHKGRFKRAADLEPVLEILEERHFIRRQQTKVKPAYRPSRDFEVNPAVYEMEG